MSDLQNLRLNQNSALGADFADATGGKNQQKNEQNLLSVHDSLNVPSSFLTFPKQEKREELLGSG